MELRIDQMFSITKLSLEELSIIRRALETFRDNECISSRDHEVASTLQSELVRQLSRS